MEESGTEFSHYRLKFKHDFDWDMLWIFRVAEVGFETAQLR